MWYTYRFAYTNLQTSKAMKVTKLSNGLQDRCTYDDGYVHQLVAICMECNPDRPVISFQLFAINFAPFVRSRFALAALRTATIIPLMLFQSILWIRGTFDATVDSRKTVASVYFVPKSRNPKMIRISTITISSTGSQWFRCFLIIL